LAQEWEIIEGAKFGGRDLITWAKFATHIVTKERDVEPGSLTVGANFELTIDGDNETRFFLYLSR